MSAADVDNSPKRAPIALLAMPALDETVLKMVIERFLSAELQIVAVELADIAILDGDSATSHVAMAEWRLLRPQAPTLMLTLQPRDDTQHLVYLRKPINIEKLIEALRRLRAMPRPPRELAAGVARLTLVSPPPPPRPAQTDGKASPSAVAADATASPESLPPALETVTLIDDTAETEGRDYCGVAADLPLQVLRDAAGAGLRPDRAIQLYFDPDVRLLGLLRRAGKLVRANASHAVYIKSLHGTLVVLPTLRVSSSIAEISLRPLCSSTMFSETLEVAPAPAQPPYELCFEFDVLLWKVALWSARGRLPRGTDPYAAFSLRRLPDYSRLTATPHAQAICQTWLAGPTSLIETLARCAVAQRYVFALYSAAQVLDLIETGAVALS